MNDMRTHLTGADPLAREGGLSGADAARIRNAVLASLMEAEPAGLFRRGAFAAAAIVALVVAAGTIAGHRPASRSARPDTGVVMGRAGEEERRQLQFATPGGTRIIWTLDPEFRLREVMP